MPVVDGDELTQWDDLSGNDNHLIKDTITGENSVTFKKEGIAGLPSVYFNGGFMETASASSTPVIDGILNQLVQRLHVPRHNLCDTVDRH